MSINQDEMIVALSNINIYARLLVESLKNRQALIDKLAGLNSPLAVVAEQIQFTELKILSEVESTWIDAPKRPRGNKATQLSAPSFGKKKVVVPHVQTFDDVSHTFSYVVPHDHYAFRICGILIHGNIGELTDARNPEKIKNCRIQKCKRVGCSFYHDPLYYGGTDRRNFIRNQEIALTPENVDKFSDRIMHDILTLLTYKTE